MRNVVSESRLIQLKELLVVLADNIDQQPGARDLAQLSRQYRETLKEIEEIEGATDDGDEIAQILSDVDADGNARTVR